VPCNVPTDVALLHVMRPSPTASSARMHLRGSWIICGRELESNRPFGAQNDFIDPRQKRPTAKTPAPMRREARSAMEGPRICPVICRPQRRVLARVSCDMPLLTRQMGEHFFPWRQRHTAIWSTKRTFLSCKDRRTVVGDDRGAPCHPVLQSRNQLSPSSRWSRRRDRPDSSSRQISRSCNQQGKRPTKLELSLSDRQARACVP